MSNSTSLHLPLLNKFTVRRGGCASWTLAPIAVIICCAHWAWENERCTSPPLLTSLAADPIFKLFRGAQTQPQPVLISVCVMQCANLWGALQHHNQWLLFMNSLWSPLFGQTWSILTFLLASLITLLLFLSGLRFQGDCLQVRRAGGQGVAGNN